MSRSPTVCIVDTNVILVANRLSDDVGEDCVRTCVKTLHDLCRTGKLVVDQRLRIFQEYRNKTLNTQGQRGPGDEFVLWVISNLYNPDHCVHVAVTPKEQDDLDYEEFPTHVRLKHFDRSDRVFVAVARAHPDHPPILEACDTDFWNARGALAECGVSVEFLCEEDVCRLAAR